MRTIEFIKDWEHPDGSSIVKLGSITGGRNFWLNEMIEKGYAREYTGHLIQGQNTAADEANNKIVADRISKATKKFHDTKQEDE